ncbi:hypothetical protein HHL17_24275 [Chitinophaga sp. G-6-1-13]|uniref:Uncharacterized protein n=1 Tax=Chitinophaga fulva TaxID=2728842 RepID=A0A848GPB2_9BACT|nr:hypothetical protein [Chitinophaga fulva]NML40336.1 hypothetical protein [Chitinophaga fulva]
MDPDTVQYILKYYSHLMESKVGLVFHYTQTLYKYKKTTENNEALTRHYRDLGWITANENVLTLLEDGFDKFEMEVAMRMQYQHGDKITFNRCPQCNGLARTPQACQCRYCGHSWRGE